MARLRFRLRTLLIAVAVLAVPMAWIGWQLNRESRESQRILKVLDEPTSFTFIEAELTDILACLKEKHQIEIQISTKAMPEYPAATSVTCEVEDVKLSTALEQILGPEKLTYVIIDGVLLVVSEEELSQWVASNKRRGFITAPGWSGR
jgi:2-phospho-L-lactate guanylyltransferase (CobY/MobA/RfbA family)